jgi:hypothetical protein
MKDRNEYRHRNYQFNLIEVKYHETHEKYVKKVQLFIQKLLWSFSQSAIRLVI